MRHLTRILALDDSFALPRVPPMGDHRDDPTQFVSGAEAIDTSTDMFDFPAGAIADPPDAEDWVLVVKP